MSYDPLPTGYVRLVKIHSTPDLDIPNIENEIEISLISAPLAECPPYVALSYTWGDPGPFVDAMTFIFTKVPRCYPIKCGRSTHSLHPKSSRCSTSLTPGRKGPESGTNLQRPERGGSSNSEVQQQRSFVLDRRHLHQSARRPRAVVASRADESDLPPGSVHYRLAWGGRYLH